jgi:hypothetical protein
MVLALAGGGCAAAVAAQTPGAPPGFSLPLTPRGWGTYQAGPLTIHLRHAEEVDFLCRSVVGIEAPGKSLHGCYVPTTKTIVAPADDAAALVHELKHYFEGPGWHR